MALQTTGVANSVSEATNAILKRVYGPRIHDQLNNEALLFSLLKRAGRERWNGSVFIESIRTGRNRAVASGGETDALPPVGSQTYNTYQIGMAQYHGVGGLSAFSMASSQLSEGAFEQLLKAEVDGLIADSKKDFNIDFYGSPLGVLAKLNGNPAADQVTLDQAQSLVAWASNGNRYLSDGQDIDFAAEANGALRAEVADGDRRVRTVNAASTTFGTGTAAGAVNAVGLDNDFVVRRGAATTVASAFSGIEWLIDDPANLATFPADALSMGFNIDTCQGVDRDTTAFARGSVIDLANGGIDETDLQNLVYQVEERSGTYPHVFLTHRSVQSSIQQLLVSDRRFVPQQFPGGWVADALVYNAGDADIPIVVDRECPYDRLYALNLDALKVYVLKDVELAEEDGSVLRLSAGNGDSWEFFFRMFANLGCTQLNANGKLVRIGAADEFFGLGARVFDF